MTRPPRRQVMVLIAAGTLVVAVHLGLGAAVPAATRWTGWAADLVLAAVLLKVVVAGSLAARRIRRRGGTARTARHTAHDGLGRPTGTEPTEPAEATALTGSVRRGGVLRHLARFHAPGPAASPSGQGPAVRCTGRVPTSRGERYARQLCDHAAHMTARAEWLPPKGVIEFPGALGTCRITAEPDALVFALEAADRAALARLQQIIGGDIERFARRESRTVTWDQSSD